MQESGLQNYLKSQKGWVETFLKEILSIPSQSGNEGDVQRCIYEKLKEWDVLCNLIPIDNSIKNDSEYSNPVKGLDYNDRPNLRVFKSGSGEKTVAINSHTDVVPPSIGQKNPFAPRIDTDGNIYARGACDAKGQIAAMALLLKTACEYKQLRPNILCHMVVEEELGGNGTLAMLRHEKAARPDVLINMEPTNLRLMTSIRGAIWFEMRFFGKSGHAGDATSTENAIFKAIQAVQVLKDFHARLLQESKDYGLFEGMDNPMPLTIGQFISGVWPSMVPSEAKITGVLGLLPNTTREEVIQGLKDELEKPENLWISKDMGLEFTYRHNAVELPVGHWFAQSMSKACEKSGLDQTPMAMTASTDAVFYNDLAIPSLAFGPGDIKFAHSSDEHININDILKATEVIFNFFENF